MTEPIDCPWCRVEMYFFCVNPSPEGEPCRQGSAEALMLAPQTGGAVGRPPLEGDQMTNVMATGRKRAETVAPIWEGMVCEWANLRNAGGGVVPIIGCDGKPASDRHHGPDKSVLNNTVGLNLHRICDHCHARWHVANDPFYPKDRPPGGLPFLPSDIDALPHDRDTRATPEEVAASEKSWTSRKKGVDAA